MVIKAVSHCITKNLSLRTLEEGFQILVSASVHIYRYCIEKQNAPGAFCFSIQYLSFCIMDNSLIKNTKNAFLTKTYPAIARRSRAMAKIASLSKEMVYYASS